MKWLVITIVFMSFVSKQTQSMTGSFKIEFEREYSGQNGTITFNDVKYIRYRSDGKKVRGQIFFKEDLVILQDKNSDLEMEFKREDIGKDAFYFRTKKHGAADEDDLILYSGKLKRIN